MRFIVTWLLMPLKIGIILLLWLITQVRQLIHDKNERYWSKTDKIDDDYLKKQAIYLLNPKLSPIVKMYGLDLYQLRYMTEWADSGEHATTDHFCARQGVYIAVLSRLGLPTEEASKALRYCRFGNELRRGYHFKNFSGDLFNHNANPVSGDMLVGFCFGYLHDKKLDIDMYRIALDLYYNKGLKTEAKISPVANFKPGYQWSQTPIPVGAQDLTYLCGIACGIDAAKRLGMIEVTEMLTKEFNKRLWIYGGFLTCLFPTAGIWFKRGYNNDNVCIQASYVLNRISSNRLHRYIFAASTLYTWSLSWAWLNSFFSGLAQEVSGLLSNEYMNRCRQYSRDLSVFYEGIGGEPEQRKASVWPINPEDQQMSEFCADEDHEYTKHGKKIYRATLGQLAYIAWLIKK